MNNTLIAFLLTIFAGLATGLGGLFVIATKSTSQRFLSLCLAFASGVMIYISFAEVLFGALTDMEEIFYHDGLYHYEGWSVLIISVSFFIGIIFMAIFDKLIPNVPKKRRSKKEEVTNSNKDDFSEEDKKELIRTGILSTFAVSIHNLPEGLMVFMAALMDPGMGLGIALAIAVHNIPEGIAIASPIYNATGSKSKALIYSTLSGLTEPFGAFIAWVLFMNVFDHIEDLFPIVFANIGGIMVFVAIVQLLPASQKFGKHGEVMKWLFIGMAFMAASLIFLDFVI